MPDGNCLVFQDGEEWIVFAPISGFIFRANASAAAKFNGLHDEGRLGGASAQHHVFTAEDGFTPTQVTIYCTNRCAQSCLYCYGKPLHSNLAEIDERFCAAGVEFAARNASRQKRTLRVIFHGAGEPTLNWALFKRCVEIAKETARRHALASVFSLSTGGQLTPARAAWVAENLDEIHISIDGPEDIQNVQRPRNDGRDSLHHPLNLAREVIARHKMPLIKSTVTAGSVERMVEMVEFVASELGHARLVFDMMFEVPWQEASTQISAPAWQRFVAEFGRAFDRGGELGIEVQHAQIDIGAACGLEPCRSVTHFSLIPPNTIAAFYDVFRERSQTPLGGAYGWYCRDSDRLHVDHKKRHKIDMTCPPPACQTCPCIRICHGPGGAKGRIHIDGFGTDPTCRAKVGVLKELLRRAVPRRTAMEEVAK